MNTLPYQRILTSINLLIENSKEMQDNKYVQEDMSRNSPLQFAKEYCTVKVCTARRTGHTTAINEFLMNKCHNCHEKWATVCFNQKAIEINYKSLLSNKNCYINFMTQNTFDNNLRGQELDGIIVDCASFMSQKKMDQLYQTGMACMINKKYKLFIFME